jgi:hypothetical protein
MDTPVIGEYFGLPGDSYGWDKISRVVRRESNCWVIKGTTSRGFWKLPFKKTMIGDGVQYEWHAIDCRR